MKPQRHRFEILPVYGLETRLHMANDLQGERVTTVPAANYFQVKVAEVADG